MYEEKKLVAEIRQRNQNAVAQLLADYGGLIRSVVTRYLGGSSGYRGECMDDVLMAVWLHIDAFDPTRSSLRNWIAGIARFQALTCLRRHQNQHTEISIDDPDAPALPCDPTEPTEEQLSQELDEMLDLLSPDDRRLLLDLYAAETGITQAAARLQISPDAAYKRAQRAKIKLRTLFPRKTI